MVVYSVTLLSTFFFWKQTHSEYNRSKDNASRGRKGSLCKCFQKCCLNYHEYIYTSESYIYSLLMEYSFFLLFLETHVSENIVLTTMKFLY